MFTSLFFEGRLRKAVERTGLLQKIEGRGAAIEGHDRGYGLKYDPAALERVYLEKLPRTLLWGRKNGLSPPEAAFGLVLETVEAYLGEHPRDRQELEFATLVSTAALLAERELPDRWKTIGEELSGEAEASEQRRVYLSQLRADPDRGFSESFRSLEDDEIPEEAKQVWRSLDGEFRTELEIAGKTELPVERVLLWLDVFRSRELVAAIGAEGSEPTLRQSPVAPKDPISRQIHTQLSSLE
ncbi:MAG: hypothetical protein ABFS46_09985 [Myxococcota bacterium]